MAVTHQLVLERMPSGPLATKDFSLRRSSLAGYNDLLLKPRFISVDPYMRTRMQTEGYDYIEHWKSGSILSGWTLAEVIHSSSPNWCAGDWAVGHLPMQDLIPHDGDGLWKHAAGLPPPLELMHPMGMTGFTAWIGMRHLGQPTANDTVLVSAAAGAVGSIAAQLARDVGARVIVTAGRQDKREWLRSIGFMEVLDHYAPDFELRLRQILSDGLTLNFENVGGRVFKAANEHMREKSRVVVCGLVSQYQQETPRQGPSNLTDLARRRVKFLPFTIPSYNDLLPAFHEYMQARLDSGSLEWRLDIMPGGLSSVPAALIGLLAGDNLGKRLVSC